MKKKLVFRGIVLSIVAIVMIGSSVYATSFYKEEENRSKDYIKDLQTDRGTYYASGNGSLAKTGMVSVYSDTLYGTIYTALHDYTTSDFIYTSNMNIVTVPGGSYSRSWAREKDSSVVDYIHCVQTYYSSSKSSVTLADSFTYVAKQYYN